jgi:hypothetical protein
MNEPKKNESPKAKEDQSINKDMIKPKNVKDKSIAYKSSNYVRDLLGEGK